MDSISSSLNPPSLGLPGLDLRDKSTHSLVTVPRYATHRAFFLYLYEDTSISLSKALQSWRVEDPHSAVPQWWR